MGIKKLFGIQTELQHLKLDEILANYKNPKFWKKKWCVFKTKDFDCIWKMKYINIESNSIESCVVLHYKGKKNAKQYWWDNGTFTSSCDSVPIDNPEYNQLIFNKNILGKVINTIDYLERAIILNSYEYKEAERLERDEREKLEKIANDFLDSESVSNKEIREAYIDHYVSKASKYDYTGEVKAQSPRKYYPTARLMACSWFDNKKMFDGESNLLKANKGIKKKVMYAIWKSRKELEGDDFVEEAEEKLESI